jgi:hypothetical protein
MPDCHWLRSALVASATSASILMTGCHAGTAGALPVAGFVLGQVPAGAAVEALVAKPNATWQDAGMTHAPVVARRQANGYRLAAAEGTGPTWQLLLPAVSSSAMAYRYLDMSYHSGGAPRANESIYVLTEAAAGTPQVWRLSATDGRNMNGAGWDALAGLKGPGSFQRSAVLLSGDNRRLYALTSGGYFVCLDADTGERLFAKKLSNAGFAGTAPYVDYSNGGGWPQGPLGSDEMLYAVSNDGSAFRVRITNGAFQVTAWPAAGGQDAGLWPGRPTLPYGQATRVNAFPVAWQQRVYVGTSDGRCVRLDLRADAPALTTWRPDWHTSAPARGITAPVALEYADDFSVSHVFVGCGDRLVWIDPARSPVEEAVIASPPLVLLPGSPAQGTLAAAPSGGSVVKGPYNCIDFASVATKGQPAPSRWGSGTGLDGRLFGADGYTQPADGNRIQAYMQFEVPLGDFGGYSPIAARIDLSAASTPASPEDVRVHRASNYVAGTNTFWTGMNFQPDIDWHNRPYLLSHALGGYKGPVSASDATSGLPRYALRFDDGLPVDQANVDDRAWATFAMVSTGKQRNGAPSAPAASQAAQWHRAVDGDNATEPKLFVTLETGAKGPDGWGVQAQPAVDTLRRKVWVVSSNALFELSYADATQFQSQSAITYSLTAAGRGLAGSAGPTATGTPRRFVMPKGNVLFTGQRLVVADHDPGQNRVFINQFTGALAGRPDSLTAYEDAGAGSGQVGEQMLWDYMAGSVYVTTRDGRLTRVGLQ